MIGERVPVAGVFPTIARNLVGTADSSRREHHGLGPKQQKAPALALVAERAGDAPVIFQQGQDGGFHVNFHPEVDSVILQSADHFEASAVADVRQARIAVSAEVALQNAAVLGAIEERAPGLELADAIGRFFGVQLRHAPVVDVLAAAHGIGEMHFPVIALIDVGHGRGDTAFGHDGVRFSEETLGDYADTRAECRCLDRCS